MVMLSETRDMLILDPTPQAPEVARQFLRTRFARWGLDDYDGQLVVSELVTNALLHGAGAIVVRVFQDEHSCLSKVEVTDKGVGRPVLRPPNYALSSGRGLSIVAALAHAWGVRPLPGGGKTVWALLPG
ncbi:ATP-binding protein [Actinomadura sp. LCR2-06]|uniref:ATP-binding protein n=1 Tax=Actinomadura violacea TaxID=2819934 RepID=A0ABS3RWB4_9ACTN|nr:ATP-binding protein [Actinomadura violacea]